MLKRQEGGQTREEIKQVRSTARVLVRKIETGHSGHKSFKPRPFKFPLTWVCLRAPVIQANGRLFKFDLRSGGLLLLQSEPASALKNL